MKQSVAGDATGNEREWTARLDEALAATEEAIRNKAAPLKPADGKVVDLDRPRLPSPTVARQTVGLRKDLGALLEETRGLRQQVRRAGWAFGPSPDFPDLAGGPPTGHDAGIPDFGTLRQSVHDLAEGLRQYTDNEVRVVLESVNTDIGAGD